jgi:hypothetical protein
MWCVILDIVLSGEFRHLAPADCIPIIFNFTFQEPLGLHLNNPSLGRIF